MQSQTTSTSASQNTAAVAAPGASSQSLQDRLLNELSPILEALGYELVHLEVQTHRTKTVRVYIDHLDSEKPAIGVQDCVAVSRALDEPLEKLTENETVLAGGYELEVSSPGVDRPLRKPSDFEKFRERDVRLHVFRALTADELKNEDYCKRNPKQKNFLGVLKGIRDGRVLLSISPSMGRKGDLPQSVQKGKKKKAASAAEKLSEKVLEKFDDIEIPLVLVSKANLEPDFDVLDPEE